MKQQEDKNDIKGPVKVNIRTFKASAEIENLYRFIGEFGLRKEAKIVFEKIFLQIKKAKKAARKKVGNKSKKVH